MIKKSNIEITEEVSLKFGKDKILISYNDPSVLELHKEKIEKYISAMILMNPHQIRETQAILSLPFFVQINQVALNKLLEIFAYENVCGVTGNTINDNVKEIVALKDLCRENDIPIESFQAAYKWEDFKKNSDGMVPVIVQDYRTQEVLMMAYMNEEAYEQTLKLGKMTYYSRSRQELWLKGLTSGHYQYVKELVRTVIWIQSLRRYLKWALPAIPEAEAASSTRSRKRIMRKATIPYRYSRKSSM